MSQLVITIHDEITCTVTGLSSQDARTVSDKFAVYEHGYVHNPRYKLGVWDGKFRFFRLNGATYVYFLPHIIPLITELGYKISNVVDRRVKDVAIKPVIDGSEFSHIQTSWGEPYNLRPYQVRVTNSAIQKGGGIVLAGTGAGKAQPHTSKILTPDGWTTMGEISIGDEVCTPHGPRFVIGKYPQGIKKGVRIHFADGSTVECCDEHLWSVKTVYNDSRSVAMVVDTKWIMSELEKEDGCSVYVPRAGRVVTRFDSLDKINDTVQNTILTSSVKHDNHWCIPSRWGSLAVVDILRRIGCNSRLDTKTGTVHTSAPHGKTLAYILEVVGVEYIEDTEMSCIEIDSHDHLYITDNYVVTHNTIISASLCNAYGKHGMKSIVIVPSDNLVQQSYQDFVKWGLDIGIMSGKVKDPDHQHIIATWQTLQNYPTVLDDKNVVIVDECQGAKAKVLKELLETHGRNARYRFGLTGTLPKDVADNLKVRVTLGDQVDQITAKELIDAGYLSTLNINIMRMKERLEAEFLPNYAAERDFLKKRKERLKWIAEFIASETGRTGSSLTLVTSIPVGKALQKLIPGSVFVYGDDDTKVRKQAYGLFKENPNVCVITTVQVGGTGLSIDEIFNLFLIDLGKSFIQAIQGVGRGLRKNVHAGKEHCEMYDFCSDTKYATDHMKDRIKFYKEAHYPYVIKDIDYLIEEIGIEQSDGDE